MPIALPRTLIDLKLIYLEPAVREYGAGLRASEIAALKVREIDSERMLLRGERGCANRLW